MCSGWKVVLGGGYAGLPYCFLLSAPVHNMSIPYPSFGLVGDIDVAVPGSGAITYGIGPPIQTSSPPTLPLLF